MTRCIPASTLVCNFCCADCWNKVLRLLLRLPLPLFLLLLLMLHLVLVLVVSLGLGLRRLLVTALVLALVQVTCVSSARMARVQAWLQTFLLGLRGAGREIKIEPIPANPRCLRLHSPFLASNLVHLGSCSSSSSSGGGGVHATSDSNSGSVNRGSTGNCRG